MEKQNDSQTPEWLRQLEQESWQAELIISGLALYGSFQLPGFIYTLIDFLIRHLPIEQYLVGYGITYAALLGISILSGFFIIHFVLRAYWVGLIGLNSVFPNGFGTAGNFYSPIYVKKFTGLLPKVPDTIRKVDEICSSLFASAFAFLMMYGMMAIVVTGLLLLYNLLSNFISTEILQPIFSLLGIVIIIFIVFGMISNLKRFRENERMQHAYFLGTKYIGQFMTPVFFKPVNQIMMTFFSNYEKGKSSIGLPFAFFTIAMTLSFVHIEKSNIDVLIRKGRVDISFFQKNRMYPVFYEDSYPPNKSIVHPVIPSELIDGAFLKVFIPVLDNEDFISENFCEPYIEDDSKSSFQNRRLKSEEKLFCYRKYHQVFVNDSLYQVEFLKQDHPHNGEFGIVGYLPTDRFRKGKNELRTVKLKNKEGEIYEEMEIPFWFAGD